MWVNGLGGRGVGSKLNHGSAKPFLNRQGGKWALVRKQLGGKDLGSAVDHEPNTPGLCQAVVVKRV